MGMNFGSVVENKDDNKQICEEQVGANPGSVEIIGEVTLAALSDVIDAFGMNSDDPKWDEYRHYDFNNNGVIDAHDISKLAKLVK